MNDSPQSVMVKKLTPVLCIVFEQNPATIEPSNGARTIIAIIVLTSIDCYPFSVLSFATSIVLRALNSTTTIAKPIAASAAATVKMKNTNTLPVA